MSDICLECREDTSFNSGKFVNRIYADRQDGVDAPYEEGYMCEECQLELEKEFEEYKE